jgi:hypothetical protein
VALGQESGLLTGKVSLKFGLQASAQSGLVRLAPARHDNQVNHLSPEAFLLSAAVDGPQLQAQVAGSALVLGAMNGDGLGQGHPASNHFLARMVHDSSAVLEDEALSFELPGNGVRIFFLAKSAPFQAEGVQQGAKHEGGRQQDARAGKEQEESRTHGALRSLGCG